MNTNLYLSLCRLTTLWNFSRVAYPLTNGDEVRAANRAVASASH